MQLIEQTGFGVRSAALTLEKPGSRVRFVLLPMIHLATPAFYKAVRRRLADCDVIVVEGVGGRRTRIVTLAYRLGGQFRRGGLVDQGHGLDLTEFRDRLIRPDLNAEQFAQGWQKIKRSLRLMLYLLAPLFGLWMLIVGPKRLLGRELALDDLPTREEEQMADAMPGLDEVLLDQRDKGLCQEIARQAQDQPPEGTMRTIGVCWGAAHMRAVLQTLHNQLGYRITEATWLTVM